MIKRSLKAGKETWVHFAGRTFVMSEKTSARGGSHHHGSATGLIQSPMPGKVLQMNCKAGEKVSEGQTLCVIEAMKMEYSLKAPFSGKVKDVLKAPGDQLNLGDKILEIVE